MKATELEQLGFTYALTHWERCLPVPMLSGHEVCLQYFEGDQYVEAHLVCWLPFVAGDEGKLHTCEMLKIDNPTEFDARNLIRWLEVQRPDLQIKFDKL